MGLPGAMGGAAGGERRPRVTDLTRAIRALPLKAHFLLLVLVFILVAVVSALYIHNQTYSDAEKAAHKHANFAARVAADDLSDQIAGIESSVNDLAANPALAQVFKHPKGCTLTITGGHIDVITPSGLAVCSSMPIKGKRDYSKQRWWRTAQRKKILDGPIRDPDTGHWSIAYAAPMPHHAGVVALISDLQVLAPDLVRKYAGGEPFLFVITDEKLLLARSIEPELFIGKPVLKSTPRSGDFTARDRQGVERFYAQTRVRRVGWHFYAGERTSAATAPGRALFRRQLSILLVGLVLMLGATVLVYWLLTQPIMSMRRAMRSNETRVPVGGPRELGALAGDINAMLGRQERERQAAKMEALGRLASGIAHDFNNLLLVISSGARSLRRRNGDSLDVKGIESVDRIDRAAHRGQQLTTQLLAFARQRVVTPVPTDLNTVVREMSQMLERLIGKQVTTRLELTPELPPILIDEGQIAQCILNLAINASDAMPDGGNLFITTSSTVIGCDEDAVPGRYVELNVSDTGTGMSADTIARVFEPFFTTKEEGTGLGLATVHGIVSAAGGLVDVFSEVGKGTTFRLRFPHAQLGDDLITDEHDEVPA